MGLGSAAGFELWPQTHPLPDLSATRANALLRIGAPHVNLGLVELPARSFTDLRIDWHTSGQARLSANGRLVAYHNAAAPGATLNIDRIIFGQPGPPGAAVPRYLVARVFVRVLLRSDSVAMFSRLLPVVKMAGDDVGRCRLRTLGNLLRLLDRLRSFMANFHQTMSQPWSEANGPQQGPFTPESAEAYDLALAAGLELSRMLRTNDFSAPDRFLESLTRLLRILRAAQPTQFDALAAEIGAAEIVPEACQELLDDSREKNRQALDPIIALLEAASVRLRNIAGGH
jgi:hypothetical protein